MREKTDPFNQRAVYVSDRCSQWSRRPKSVEVGWPLELEAEPTPPSPLQLRKPIPLCLASIEVLGCNRHRLEAAFHTFLRKSNERHAPSAQLR